MLLKLLYSHKHFAPGEIVEVETSIARRLIQLGRAVLVTRQEQAKKLKHEENKMVTNYENKSSRPKRKRGRPQGSVNRQRTKSL